MMGPSDLKKNLVNFVQQQLSHTKDRYYINVIRSFTGTFLSDAPLNLIINR